MKLLLKFLRKLQYLYYDCFGYIDKIQFFSCGMNVKFFGKCYIKNHHKIDIGNNVTFNDGAYLNGMGGIKIGNNVSVSALSIIVSTALDPDTLKTSKKHIDKKIFIGDNVQIGVGAIILSGITIGDNVIVGAGSVVTKNVDSNCIVAGNPARVIRIIKQ